MAFEMPRANKPEDVGLSSQRLQRIRDTLQADIDKGLRARRGDADRAARTSREF